MEKKKEFNKKERSYSEEKKKGIRKNLFRMKYKEERKAGF